jgi:hypothetical protein
MKRGEHIHPADKDVFGRMNPGKHGFELDCLSACFAGRLKTATVVLLYLSPGHDQAISEDAKTEETRDYYFRRYRGDEPFRDTGPGKSWIREPDKDFADHADFWRNSRRER